MRKLTLISELRLEAMTDVQLESARFAYVTNQDERLEPVVQLLLVRAVPVIELVCRERGARSGLTTEQTMLAMADTTARLALRVRRPARLPAVNAVAARIAARAVDAQLLVPRNQHALVQPHLRLVLVKDPKHAWRQR